MNTNKITLAIFTAVYAASMVYMVDCSNKKDEDIVNLKLMIEDANNKINDVSVELQDKDKEIESLTSELEEKNNALESARQKIRSIESKVSYNSSDVTAPSRATVTHMKRALKGTALYEHAEDFVRAEEQEGVNAFLLAGIAALESSWGTSERAKYDNNLTGYGVYNKYSRGINPNSKSEGILRTARVLRKEYLTPGGQYFNGYSARDVNTKYCFEQDMKTVDYKWSKSVSSIAYDLVEKANNF